MVLVKTRVVNNSDVDLVLKVGNAGVFSKLAYLRKNDGKYDITVNTNTTYREYWIVAESQSSVQLIISSDDAVECGEMRADKKFDLIRIPRTTKRAEDNGVFGRLLTKLGLQN